MCEQSNRTRQVVGLADFHRRKRPPRNKEKFKYLEGTDGLYEFKTTSLRLFCFFDTGAVIVCATGMVKKQDRHNPTDLKTALAWKAAYFQAKANNELSYETEHP